MKKRWLILLFLASLYSCSTRKPEVRLLITGKEDFPGIYGDNKIEYEKVYGLFTGEVDIDDPHNAIITDLGLAERNERGMAEYSSEFFIIKPKDMSLARGILRFDAPNRGNAYGARPDSLFLARGYVFLSGAWQGDVKRRENETPGYRLYLKVPIAKSKDGSPLTGIVRVEFASSSPVAPLQMDLCGNIYNSGHESYVPVSYPGNDGCILTKRKRESDPRIIVSNDEWGFASTSIDNLFPGTPDSSKISIKDGFEMDYIYELIYTAKDPKVMGLGLAAVRDMVTFFKKSKADANGTLNPLYGYIKSTLGTGSSQSGNFMKTFLHLGFNEDLSGEKVFDGIFPEVAARQNNINMRFAVPGGGGGPRTEHRAFGQSSVRAFPAGYYDENAGTTGGIFTRSEATGTTPKVFMLLTSAEMWSLQASPIFHDAYGKKDIEQPDNLRIYYLAGGQHSISANVINWRPESTLYPGSTAVDGSGIKRALWIAFEDWVVNGVEPPASMIPKIKDGSLVPPEDLKFPEIKGLSWNNGNGKMKIPDFTYFGIINSMTLLDFGPDFIEYDESGIATILPPDMPGNEYAIMVSQVDEDGNEIAGIRSADLLVPTGTSFGFNYTTKPELGDLAGLSGAFIPFHKTKQERLAAGDTRLSLEERYGNKTEYIKLVTEAVQMMISRRLLLQEDGDKIIERAKNSDIFN